MYGVKYASHHEILHEYEPRHAMNYFLENPWLQLRVDPTHARWSLIGRHRYRPSIEDAQVSVHYRCGRARGQTLTQWPSASISNIETISSPHGSLRTLSLQTGPDQRGLLYTLTFALPENHAMLMWKISIDNQGERPVALQQIELFSAGFIYPSRPGLQGRVLLSPQPERPKKSFPEPSGKSISKNCSLTLPRDYAFYSNGWQSWSNARVYAHDEHFRRTRLGPLREPIIINPETPKPSRSGLYASDMFGVLGDRSHRSGILLGFLSQKQHFGSLEAWIGSFSPAMRMWASGDGADLNPGNRVETDWACAHFLHLDTANPLAPYLDAVAREHDLDPAGEPYETPPKGWCSWYHFFREVTAQDIRANLNAAAGLSPELPLDVIQIDDGYEAQVGDWLTTNEKFPAGLAPLAAEIREAGFSPGIWLAPFLVNLKSNLAANHPDWLLSGRLGRPVNAGHLWNAFHTALDLTHPETLAYVSDLISTAVDKWGFPYLKLDFLYAAALPGRHKDPTRTRAQVLRAGLERIRAAAGEKTFLLGCGCPLGPAIGLVDAMRIGADVAHHWNPVYRGITKFFKNGPDSPSARNAIHNSLARSALHLRWWINDPDCLLLDTGDTRTEAATLNLAEIQTLATVIAMTGGSLLLSDHLPDLPAERLRIAECLIPLIGKRPHVLDWFDNPTPTRLQLNLKGELGSWHLLALFNWQDSPKDISLHMEDFYLDPQLDYYGREFWGGTIYQIAGKQTGGAPITLQNVPAHGTALLAVRPHRNYQPEYLGSNLHISQGLEVTAWDWKSSSSSGKHGELRFQIERPGRAEGEIELYLPYPPQEASLEREPLVWQTLGGQRYLLTVAFDQTAKIGITF